MYYELLFARILGICHGVHGDPEKRFVTFGPFGKNAMRLDELHPQDDAPASNLTVPVRVQPGICDLVYSGGFNYLGQQSYSLGKSKRAMMSIIRLVFLC